MSLLKLQSLANPTPPGRFFTWVILGKQDLEELRKQLGLVSITLLGHSWGGLLGMHYAVCYPKHVSALILLSTAPADFKGEQAFVSEFDKRTQAIKKEIALLTNYQEFEKLNVAQITKLYRIVSTVYFYNPKDVAKLTLDLDKNSAKNGMKVMQIMSEFLYIRNMLRYDSGKSTLFRAI